MKILNKKIYLDEILGVSVLSDLNPETATLQYKDKSGNEFVIPVSNIIRLGSVLQNEVERNDLNFKEFCDLAIKASETNEK